MTKPNLHLRSSGYMTSSSSRLRSSPPSPISDLDERTLAKVILKSIRPSPDVAHNLHHFILSTHTTGSMFLDISDKDLKRVLAGGDQQLFKQLKDLRHQPYHFYEELFRRLSSSMPSTPQFPSRLLQITNRDSETPMTSTVAGATTNEVPVTQERSYIAPGVVLQHQHATPTFVENAQSPTAVVQEQFDDTGIIPPSPPTDPLPFQQNSLGLHVDSQVPQADIDAADDTTNDTPLQPDPMLPEEDTHEDTHQTDIHSPLTPSVILHPLHSDDGLADGHADIEHHTPSDDDDRNIYQVQNDILPPPISPSSRLLPLLSNDWAGCDTIVISVIPPDDDVTFKHHPQQDTTPVSSSAQLPSPSESQSLPESQDNFAPDHGPVFTEDVEAHSAGAAEEPALGESTVNEIGSHSETPIIEQSLLCSHPDGSLLNDNAASSVEQQDFSDGTSDEVEVDDPNPVDNAHTPVSVVTNPDDSTAPLNDSASAPQEKQSLAMGHVDECASSSNVTAQMQLGGGDVFVEDDDPPVQELGAGSPAVEHEELSYDEDFGDSDRANQAGVATATSDVQVQDSASSSLASEFPPSENGSAGSPTNSTLQESLSRNHIDFFDNISDPMPQSAVLKPSPFIASPPTFLSRVHDSLPGPSLQASTSIPDNGIPQFLVDAENSPIQVNSTTPNSESTSTSSVDNAIREGLQPLVDGTRDSDLPEIHPDAASGDDVAELTMVGSPHNEVTVEVQLFDSSLSFSPAISSSWSTLATDAISPKVYLMEPISPDVTFHGCLDAERFVHVAFVEELDNDEFVTSTPLRIPGALDVRGEEVLSSDAGTQASSRPDILTFGLGEPSSEDENYAGVPPLSPLQVETSADIAANDISQNTLGLSVTDSTVQRPALITEEITASGSDSNIGHGDAEATLIENNVQGGESSLGGKQTLSLLLPCLATTSFSDEISPSIDLIFGPPSATANSPSSLPESSRQRYSRGNRTLWQPSDLISDDAVLLEREKQKQRGTAEDYIDVGTQTDPDTEADRSSSSSFLLSPLSALFNPFRRGG